MVLDVYALTWRFVHLISHYIDIAALLSSRDQSNRPRSYRATKFRNLGNVNITEAYNPSSDPSPLLTSNVLRHF